MRGPSHCGWQSVVFLAVAWPLGTSMETAEGDDVADTRHYVRDAAGVLSDGRFAGTLDLDAQLPGGSTATGYEMPSAELWLGPDGGDTYAYLVRDNDTVERWPRDEEIIACS